MSYPIKNKALKNKAEKALWEMLKIKKTNWTQNLQWNPGVAGNIHISNASFTSLTLASSSLKSFGVTFITCTSYVFLFTTTK